MCWKNNGKMTKVTPGQDKAKATEEISYQGLTEVNYQVLPGQKDPWMPEGYIRKDTGVKQTSAYQWNLFGTKIFLTKGHTYGEQKEAIFLNDEFSCEIYTQSNWREEKHLARRLLSKFSSRELNQRGLKRRTKEIGNKVWLWAVSNTLPKWSGQDLMAN